MASDPFDDISDADLVQEVYDRGLQEEFQQECEYCNRYEEPQQDSYLDKVDQDTLRHAIEDKDWPSVMELASSLGVEWSTTMLARVV